MNGARQATRRKPARSARVALVLLPLLAFAGCGGDKGGFEEPPPPKVVVTTPVVRDVQVYEVFTGHAEASVTAEVRARITGVLQRIHYRPGATVAKGDLLFTIDPQEYDAAVRQAEADLETARVELKFAENDLARREHAFKENAISEVDLLRARAEREKAQAAVAAAEARLAQARLVRSFCDIRAPVGGRVSRQLVDPGNVVNQGQATLLATIRAFDPIEVTFRLDERTLAAISGRKEGSDHRELEVRLALPGQDEFSRVGRIVYIGNSVDPSTGTVPVRARFDNADERIYPGMFCRVRVPARVLEGAILVPERAIGIDQAGRYVFVVGKDDTVEQRTVAVGPRDGELRVIARGLEPAERVVVGGMVRVRPGIKVEAVTEKEHREQSRNPSQRGE